MHPLILPVRCWKWHNSSSKLQIQPEDLQYLHAVAAVQRKDALLLTPTWEIGLFGFLLSCISIRAIQQTATNKQQM